MSKDENKLTDRHYGEVPCIHFDRRGCGPIVGELAVRANAHPSPNYPDQRVYVGAWGENAGEMDFGGMCLTVASAVEIVKLLKRAIAEVSKNAPHLLVPVVEVEDLS